MRVAASILRLALYPVGFGSTLVISRLLGGQEFGRFAILQSITEAVIILMTLGAWLSISRKVSCEGDVPSFGMHVRIVSIGLLPSAVIVLIVGYLEDWLSTVAVFLLIGSALMQSLGLLRLASYRGLNKATMLSVEPMCRYILVVIILEGINILHGGVSLVAVLSAFFVANAVIVIYLEIDSNRFVRCRCGSLSEFTDFRALTYTIFQYVSRKADVVFVGFLYGAGAAAGFKLAFPVMEAPVQLYMAYLVSFTSGLASIKHGAEGNNGLLKMLLVKSVFVGISGSVASCLMVYALCATGIVKAEANIYALALIPTFLVRPFTSVIEQAVSLSFEYKRSVNMIYIDVITKVIVILSMGWWLQASYACVSLVLSVVEFIVYVSFLWILLNERSLFNGR